jgi:indolepyruvate ferredoxin oxidoreductase beta subunit
VGLLRSAGIGVYAFDASAIARSLGEIRLINTVMLGAIADHLPFPAEVLKEQILERFRGKKASVAALNEQAFEAGRAGAKAAARDPLGNFRFSPDTLACRYCWR